MMKKTLLYAAMIIVIIFLCSCQNSPAKQVVTSKNDDDSKMHIEATGSEQGNQGPELEDVFFSTDGTVEFHFNIGEISTTEDFPIYEVVPHYCSAYWYQHSRSFGCAYALWRKCLSWHQS